MDKYIYDFMAATIEVAATNPMAPYGAIIVYDDKEILLKSVNNAHNNPLMHGELSVIHRLFENGFDGDVSRLSLYTTAEPCPMCAAAIYWAMIPKVVYGSSISFLHELFGRQIQVDAKEILSKTPNFYECQLLGGVMEKNCNQLFIEAKKLREL
ncbi:TPA: nucleoside deaminase [Legionella pneumophila]|uniref:Nucleoside deaminase n=2 Tax=Legionella pneumophila TaxID=446 RepID=A0AAN5PJY5_LEGPN|nr:nucleoside deaminase [Legionella pneumophila]ERH45632.1 cytidine deaminase [Legionella pneumophila str. Leg01/11]ERH46903.1 cytidine deaminase [Legionella pneumophila str. Leg01/53]ERI47460.1 cytidine deaminase [Legionella pneumophila str. Leg01/20]ANN94353.1 tRNA-specific adenosine deaminase [Legionella pneumophila]AOU09250.1 tRNA-specific adenosine deaminase [Legionella pneumophila]